MRSRAASLLLVVSLATATAVASPAEAQGGRKKPNKEAQAAPTNKARAAELFQASADAYMHGDFAAAIKLLDEAYALDPQPVLVYNQARSHEGLGHVDEAIALYQRYLSEEPGSSDRGAIEQRLATLKKQQEERQRIQKEQADVDAARAKQAEREQRLEAREKETAPSAPPPKRSVFPYVVAGAGAVGLAAGTVFGVLALGREDAGEEASSLRDATEARDTGKTFATVSNVSFIIGGALVACGIVWWVLDRKSSTPRREAMFPGARF